MTHRRKISSALALVVITVICSAGVARAQVPYDPTKKLVTLASVTSDASGNVSADLTLPDDVTAGYEILANGKAPDGSARSVLADVEITGSAMPASVGGHAAVLIAYTQTVVRSVHVTASGFLANSKVSFAVRFSAPATSGVALPFTGSNVGLLIAIVAAVLLVGGPLTFGSRRFAAREERRAVD